MRLVIDLQGAQSDSRDRGIGRYSRALAMAMAESAGAHEILVALNGSFRDATEDLRDAFAAVLPSSQLRVWYGPGRQTAWKTEDWPRRAAAERIRAAFLESLRPDLLLVTSQFEGYGDDAVTVLPADFIAPPTVSICYDLIPMLRPETYLNSALLQDWYYRRLLQLTHSDGLLCISEFSRTEIMSGLGVKPDKVANILAGVGPHFRPAQLGDEPQTTLLARYGLTPGYVLCVGAVEERKNLAGLIRGYAMLPAELRRKHPLVATGWNDPQQLPPLRRLAAELGLAEDELRLLTAFVPDRDLPGLYRASAVTICPSLHEGFGLSVAEGMACGVATLCSDTSSLPEVMDRPDALFDPKDPASLAARLRATLESSAFRRELGQYGLARAHHFTWTNTARRAWAAVEPFAKPRLVSTAERRKPRLAVVTGLQGDLTRLRALLQGLSAWYAVEIISEDPPPADMMIHASFPIRAPAKLEENAADRLLYWPGADAGVAAQTLRMLDAYPGVVIAPAGAFGLALLHASGTDADLLADLLLDFYGWPAAVALRDAPEATLAQFPVDDVLRARALHLVQDLNMEPAALHAVIEQAYATNPIATLDACLTDLARSELVFPEAALAVATTFSPAMKRGVFLDISTIAAHDAGTGIQRVVRETARQLGSMATLETRIEFVRHDGKDLLLARAYGHRLFGLPDTRRPPALAQLSPGDVFIGLDLNMHDVGGLADTIHLVRARGARAVVVIYDLLPVLMPHCFPMPVQSMFPFWLRTISRLADGLVCISRAVADELLVWLDANPPPRTRKLDIGWFHLGADFRPAAPEGAVVQHACLTASAARPSLLIVGTLEPRKGQADALTALDALWDQGLEVGLTLVGRTGWGMQALEQRIIAHPELGRRLHWVQDADDHLVAALYQRSGALLMASEGEGFGLPLVEAAHAGLPVIARDLPIFREVCGEHALYFSGGANPLAATIERWLGLRARGMVPDPAQITTVSWHDSAHRLADIVLNDVWYAQWTRDRGDRQ